MGGIVSVAALASLVSLLVYTTATDAPDWTAAIASIMSFGLCVLGTVWATGFWGRRGMAVFFAAAALLLVIEFSANPLFPIGTIFIAGF